MTKSTTNWTAIIGSITAIILGVVQATHGLKIEENKENHEVSFENIKQIQGQIVELPYLRKEVITNIIAELRQRDEAQDLVDIRQDIRLDALEREEHRHLPYLESPIINRKENTEVEKK